MGKQECLELLPAMGRLALSKDPERDYHQHRGSAKQEANTASWEVHGVYSDGC